MMDRVGAVGAALRVKQSPALAPCRPHRIGHDCASHSKRFLSANRRIECGLMFNFGVQLATEQDHNSRNPHPHHHADRGSKRAISRVVGAKIGDVPREEHRANQPYKGGRHASH
jgi:hypothetical protein